MNEMHSHRFHRFSQIENLIFNRVMNGNIFNINLCNLCNLRQKNIKNLKFE